MSIASSITEIAQNVQNILTQVNNILLSKGVSDSASDFAEVPGKIYEIQQGSTPTGTKNITENGTYDVSEFASASVAVPEPSGTKTITTNGTHDVSEYASATVNVPTDNPPSGTVNITANGTVDVTNYASAAVSVPTGTARSSSDLTVSEATVTVPAGLYTSSASKSVATATKAKPSITVNTTTGKINSSYTQSAGYVTSGTVSADEYSLSTKSAATIYPSTSDQSIASGKYLTGNQTIKAVTTTNLTAANIKQGVTVKVGDASNSGRIASITGSYVGVGDIDDLVTHATMNATTSGGALVFNVPSGTTIAGMYISRANAASGTIQELLILSSAGSPSTVVICQKSGSSTILTFNDSGNAYYYVFQSGDDPTVSNVNVYVDSSATGGFDVGTYKAIPFFME